MTVIHDTNIDLTYGTDMDLTYDTNNTTCHNVVVTHG